MRTMFIKSNALKACPFCGDEAGITKDGANVFVKCINCYARTDGFEFTENASESVIINTTMKVVEEWNRREPPNYLIRE